MARDRAEKLISEPAVSAITNMNSQVDYCEKGGEAE